MTTDKYYDEQFYNENENHWKISITTAVRLTLFDERQFLSCEKQEVFGSDWQKKVCNKSSVPKVYQQPFWNRVGKVEARKTLNKRRQTCTNAMKKTFIGTYERKDTRWLFLVMQR